MWNTQDRPEPVEKQRPSRLGAVHRKNLMAEVEHLLSIADALELLSPDSSMAKQIRRHIDTCHGIIAESDARQR